MIKVTRVNTNSNQVYIGRGLDRKNPASPVGKAESPLANPFKMIGSSKKERNRVCNEYETWFFDKVVAKDPEVIGELRRIYKLARAGDVELACFCAPNRCHGDTIKRFLDKHLEK